MPNALATATDDAVAQGRAARAEVPRSAQATWDPPADRPEPVETLGAQDATRVPKLVPIRYGRMAASPFAFFRGAAAIMAADLGGTPSTVLASPAGRSDDRASVLRRSARW
jgi:hypothetical protein